MEKKEQGEKKKPAAPSLMGMPSSVQAQLGLGTAAPVVPKAAPIGALTESQATPLFQTGREHPALPAEPVAPETPPKFAAPWLTMGPQGLAIQDGGSGGEVGPVNGSPPKASPPDQLTRFKSQEGFRKAGLADIIQAAAAGWGGNQSMYAQQRAQYEAQIADAQAKAEAQAQELAAMAEQYRLQGMNQQAAQAFQAAENVKERAFRASQAAIARQAQAAPDAEAFLKAMLAGGR